MPIPPQQSEETDRFIEVVFPQHLNHHGTLFGGEALRMMGTTAFVTATRHSRRTMVLVGVENVDFDAPVRQGEIVEIVTRVAKVGRTSVEIAIEMVSEELLSGEQRRCGSGSFTFVAVDEAGQSIPIGDGD